MIPQNEIRVGSKVLLNGKLRTVTKSDYATYLKNGVFSLFNPIVLTHAVMLKAGCTYFQNVGNYSLSGYSIEVTNKNPLVFVLEPKYWAVEVKSLHQLQNIIFSLSNKELVYTP